MAKRKEETIKKVDAITESENEKKFGRFLEEARFTNDYMKHIATLDTGLIIIMITFLHKTIQPEHQLLFIASYICLIVSIVAVVATQNLLNHYLSVSAEDVSQVPTQSDKRRYLLTTLFAYFTFIAGLIFLVTVVVNTSS